MRRRVARMVQRLVPESESERVARRRKFGMSYYNSTLALIETWAAERSEEDNFLYDIDGHSRTSLAHLLAVLFGGSAETYRAYFREIEEDTSFHHHVTTQLREALPDASSVHIGRRLGWYAIAQHLKPRLVIETGVDFGLGSCVLCAALLRNKAEGFAGQYIGTDNNPLAGRLFAAPYNTVGCIAYGDSIETLSSLRDPVDLFINDSDHTAGYEAREYEIIAPLLNARSVVLSDNSHANTVLADFSEKRGRRYAFFKEVPKDHWYPGAGIGISVGDVSR